MPDKRTGAKVFALETAGWLSIKKELEDTFPSEADLVMERMGYSYGSWIASRAAKLGGGSAFDELARLAVSLGWGRLAVATGDPLGSSSSITLDDCAFCSTSVKDSQGCEFFAGILHGLLDTATDSEHGISEPACVCRGDPSCRFDVEST